MYFLNRSGKKCSSYGQLFTDNLSKFQWRASEVAKHQIRILLDSVTANILMQLTVCMLIKSTLLYSLNQI